MTILDTVLVGMLAGVITLKAVLMATAALLLVYGMTELIRQRKLIPVCIAGKHPGRDLNA